MCTSFGFYFFSPHTLLLTLFQYLFRVYKYHHHHHHMQRHGRHDDDRTRINTVLNVVCAGEGQASNFRKKVHTHTHTQRELQYMMNRHMIFFFIESERRYNTASLDACVLPMSEHTHTYRRLIWDRWSSKESRNENFLSQSRQSTRNMKNFPIHRKKSYKSAVNILCVCVLIPCIN